MTITIDKKNTTVANLPMVRERNKELKCTLTDRDLLRMLNENSGYFVDGEILKCEVESFAGGYNDEEVTFCVEIIVYGIARFHRVRFFVNSVSSGSYKFHEDNRTVAVYTYEQVF